MTIRIDYSQALVIEVLHAFMLQRFANQLIDQIEIDDHLPGEAFSTEVTHHGYDIHGRKGEILTESVEVWIRDAVYDERDEGDFALAFISEFSITWKDVRASLYRDPDGVLQLGRWEQTAA